MLTLFMSKAIGQEFIELSDGVVLCRNGALPHYIICNDSVCKTAHYSNNNLIAEGFCKNQLKDSIWVRYYETGARMSEGKIKNGLPFGKWTFYYDNGNKKAEGYFGTGKFELGCSGSGNFIDVSVQTGSWSYWFENGLIKHECNFSINEYEEQVLSGEYCEYYRNGYKKESGGYKNGMKNGDWIYYYSTGALKRMESYLYQDCGLHDYTWYECPTGEWRFFKQDGSLEKELHYKDGVLVRDIIY